jgi:hypothetical protein
MGRADLHTHTKHSGLGIFPFLRFPYPESATEPEALIAEAEKKGLDLVCVTDHNTITGALKARELSKRVVVGEEITSADGEIIGLFLNSVIKAGMSAEETIERIHDQGGLAVAPHPYSVICSSLRDSILSLDLDGIEVFNAYHRDGYSNRIALIEGAETRKSLVGGSDAHYLEMVGNGFTTFDGSDEDDLYRALRDRRTDAGGRLTPLIQGMRWSVSITTYGLRSLIGGNSDFDLERTAIKKKIAGVVGAVVYLFPPVIISCGLISDTFVRRKGERMWSDFRKERYLS